jgi:hypothetical protein
MVDELMMVFDACTHDCFSKKRQVKKVVCEVPAAGGGVSSDLWAWRKYGQKPIKGSPYPRYAIYMHVLFVRVHIHSPSIIH